MKFKKILFLLFFFINITNYIYANINDKIISKVGNEIITNYDIINEINTILALSNRAANHEEFDNLRSLAFASIKKKIILLKCTSDYPASNKNINLETIKFLKKKFKCEIGFSDHTKGIGAAVAAVANGATVIEKHFTHNKNVKSVDVEFSLGPSEMKSLVEETKNAWESQGKVKFSLSKSEKSNLKFSKTRYNN